MVELLLSVLGNKHLFTVVILSLYCIQVLFQVFYVKDYLWAGYWFGAVIITVFATQLSQRGVSL